MKNSNMELNIKSFYRTMNKKLSNRMQIPRPFVTQFAGQFPSVVLLSCGPTRLWKVHVRKCDHGRLNFNSGWSDFLHDNNLEINDLLIFRYVKKRRFQVEIFESSGCLKKFNSIRRCDADIYSDKVSEPMRGTGKGADENVKEKKITSMVNDEFSNKANGMENRGFFDVSSESRKRKVMEVVDVKKEKPTSDEMYTAVVDILMEEEEEEDICSVKDASRFVLKKLRKLFGVDLVGRKSEVKSIIDTFMMDNSDEDETELQKCDHGSSSNV